MVAFYNTGTISINSGSTALTGVGTEWNENVRPGMAVEFLDEHGSFEILSVNSNTSITLGRPRVGGNLSGAPYQIVPIRGLDITNQNLLSELITDYQDVVLGIGAGLIPDGTASTPALRFSADQDTGVYRIGANAFGVATGGALRMAVVGTNNFLLGGATTSAYSATNRTAVQIDGVEGVVLAFRAASTNRGYMFATADQILLEAEPTAQLKLSTLGSKPIVIATANVDRFKFLETGPFVGGKAASDVTVQGVEINPSGSFSATSVNTFGGYFNRLSSDGSVISLRRQGTEVGNIFVTTTATTYNTSSDYRLKENLEPLTGSGAFIDALNPVRGMWKNGGDTFIGLIAHEVQEVCETPVATGEKDGEDMQALAYGAPEITAHMIAELKSLRARVAALEAAE
ncbi:MULTISPECIES: tail fiber domain-containing protein [Sphingomonadales]|uniref:tail fiber domain-containing protein n=1 Tax=Sphingomonadales TaxID=204457 RepID=UPI00082509DF|nr:MULTISPECIES: tail fiber domain-containing protein [Sphingomonadales]